MSRLFSRSCSRVTSSPSVSPSIQTTATLVWVSLPATLWENRSAGVRRWRRRRAVLVRMVSVKASFGPLMVFSTVGAEMPRFSGDLTS